MTVNTFEEHRPSRRRFLGSTIAAGAAALAPAGFVRGADGPAEKLNMAIIGCGGRGKSNMQGVASERIYAVCDTNPAAIADALKAHPDAKSTQDWRTLIDDPKIDAFVISTADHHHALASLAALNAGKHVYCEKPLAHTAREARMMQEACIKQRGKIATQMGTQIHATENYRRVVELVRSGMIGPVTEAHVWCSRGINPVGQAVLDEQPVPEGFAWDAWLGPASNRPHNSGYWKGGNLNWNRRWEFGNGVLGDMGSHLIDLPFWALDLKRPTTVESSGPAPDDIECPPWQQVKWEHPARQGDAPHHAACTVVWYHGNEGMKRRTDYVQPKVGSDTDISKWGNGIAFIGDKGVIVADYSKIVLSPAATFDGKARPEPSIPKSTGQYNEWIHAIRTGGESLCNFDYSGALIEHNLLGNIAHRVGGKLNWDAAAFKFTDSPAANALLTKQYRDGWKPKGV